MTSNDERLMGAALGLARRGLGQVWPNPAVGCLLVRELPGRGPRIVSRGWTRAGGRPHAETEALSGAGDAARGATAYVTLEPCAHHGQTPPCATALIDAGVSRVVSAMEDPDPRVCGAGHAQLLEADIAVDVGVMAAEAAALNAGFVSRVTLGRPRVTLKLALSGDHKLAARPGVATSITGEAARKHVHMMRAMSDAIMVGSGTWRVDNPALTCRLPGLEERSPVRVVIDVQSELPTDARLFEDVRRTPLWILAGEDASARATARQRTAGADVLRCHGTSDGQLDLADVLMRLGARGITRLLVEGGARLAARLVAADLVDEIVLITADRQLGPDGVPALADRDLGEVLSASFTLASRDRLGADELEIHHRCRDHVHRDHQ